MIRTMYPINDARFVRSPSGKVHLLVRDHLFCSKEPLCGAGWRILHKSLNEEMCLRCRLNSHYCVDGDTLNFMGQQSSAKHALCAQFARSSDESRILRAMTHIRNRERWDHILELFISDGGPLLEKERA